MVDAQPIVNAFNGRLDKLTQTMVSFSWTNPLSPRPMGWLALLWGHTR